MACTPLLLKYLGSSAAFSVPGLFMAIALVVFWAGRSLYILVMPSKDKPAGFLSVSLHCLRQALKTCRIKVGRDRFSTGILKEFFHSGPIDSVSRVDDKVDASSAFLQLMA